MPGRVAGPFRFVAAVIEAAQRIGERVDVLRGIGRDIAFRQKVVETDLVGKEERQADAGRFQRADGTRVQADGGDHVKIAGAHQVAQGDGIEPTAKVDSVAEI